MGHIQLDKCLNDALDTMRGAAYAADEVIARLLATGGDSRSLIRLVLQVLNHAPLVSASVSKLLL